MTGVLFVRRDRLGKGSCHGIRRNSRHAVKVCRNTVRNRRGYPEHVVNARGIREVVTHAVRWGCTDRIPEGLTVIQSAAAIHQVNDKTGFRRRLLDEGEELAPRTWMSRIDAGITYPCIVRPGRHAQGRQLYVCNNVAELNRACGRCENYYISELIDKSAEYRMFVVQGRVAAVAQKTPGNPDDVAWNVAQGGRFDNVRFDDWPLQAVRKAVEAFNLSDLDFGGVDMMVDQEGRAYVIEINSAPSLPLKSDGDPTYRQAAMAKCFDYLIDHGTERIPLVDRRGGYLKFIHPACSDRAELV